MIPLSYPPIPPRLSSPGSPSPSRPQRFAGPSRRKRSEAAAFPKYPPSIPRMPFCSPSLPLPSLNHRCSTRRRVSVSRSRAVASAGFWQRSRGRNVCLVGNGSNPSIDTTPDGLVKKRSIVEHIFLLSAKAELSEDEEKDMLDHLYTSQYQMSGIIAISLGRIADTNVDNFTHAVYMRFQKREDITKFYVNSYYTEILKGHVTPYCYVCPSMDQFLWIMNLK